MDDLTENSSPEPRAHNPEISYAAWIWLAGPQERAVRIEPVIAIVRTLLEIMTDQFRTDEEVYASLRRAVRLLSAFTATEEPRPLNRHDHR